MKVEGIGLTEGGDKLVGGNEASKHGSDGLSWRKDNNGSKNSAQRLVEGEKGVNSNLRILEDKGEAGLGGSLEGGKMKGRAGLIGEAATLNAEKINSLSAGEEASRSERIIGKEDVGLQKIEDQKKANVEGEGRGGCEKNLKKRKEGTSFKRLPRRDKQEEKVDGAKLGKRKEADEMDINDLTKQKKPKESDKMMMVGELEKKLK
jgi:hypothetical protein